MFVEVEQNPNCESSVFLRFKELASAKRVVQVKSYERNSKGEWCWVVGWSDDLAQPNCVALAQAVEDSGTGLAYLVFGGNWGIRLKPVSVEEDWNLGSQNQWGEPYLVLLVENDLRYDQEEDLNKR